MGIGNCCSKNDNDKNSQATFENGNIITENVENVEKQTEKFYSKLNNKQFETIKSTFENIVKYQGEFIKDKTIEEIINGINPFANKIELPKEKKNIIEPNCFISPTIKFHNGEIYNGSWNINNQRQGYGINISPNGIIYKGLWKEDKVGDYGLFIDLNGNYYEGELKDGKSNGQGKIILKNKYKYEGTFKNDFPNGKGCLENFENETKYKGDFINGKKEGKGTFEYKDGTVYEGDFKNDQFEGIGSITFPDGRKYQGDFKEGKIQGKGKFIWKDGKMYVGDYEDFMKKGYGKFIWNDNKYYTGQWLNNKQHGKGVIHYNGKEINGTFRFGKIIKENKIE